MQNISTIAFSAQPHHKGPPLSVTIMVVLLVYIAVMTELAHFERLRHAETVVKKITASASSISYTDKNTDTEEPYSDFQVSFDLDSRHRDLTGTIIDLEESKTVKVGQRIQVDYRLTLANDVEIIKIAELR